MEGDLGSSGMGRPNHANEGALGFTLAPNVTRTPILSTPSGSIVDTGPLSVILEGASSDRLELFRALTAMQGGVGFGARVGWQL